MASDEDRDPIAKLWEDVGKAKERGNTRFGIGDVQAALYEYAKGLEMIKAARKAVDPAAAAATPTMWDPSTSGPAVNDPTAPLYKDPDPARLKLEVDLRGNVAQCCLSLERYGQCLEECRNVLKLDPSSDKAVYRSAKAYLGLGDVERAEGLLEDLEERHTTSAIATALLQQIRSKKQAQKDKAAEKASVNKDSGSGTAGAAAAPAPAPTTEPAAKKPDLAAAMKRAMQTGGLYADMPKYDEPLPPPLPTTKLGALASIFKELAALTCSFCSRRKKPEAKTQ